MQQDNNTSVLDDLKEIRKKQYEESLLRKRNTNSKKKAKEEKEKIKETVLKNENEVIEETKPLLETETEKETSNNKNSNNIKDDDNFEESSVKTKVDLANDRRKNRGFESKDSKLLHILFIIYYHIKTFFLFIYMFIQTLISPQASKKYSQKKKPNKFSSFDTFRKDNADANFKFGMCSSCGN
ncbi:hypothetical protein H8356DRAFT_1720351 [Neocallimastix lanati (nom. inval.)]|jgi:ElaB/YqjD/DUF883 family membrane-anchored ribosome-binding protein|uniref:Uncharacterized protein n=1 Tax=Neocallimastix californiae TaxID=1754190 RepID=A0A1Y2AQR3_9FUNG|nr:hypothetical protein H8356DRAFT_1720351 [Neocallimastix sp. JGI-2020a]ORY24909.1 hypothetical protein LY90DRAFT_706439 [Neocallimastix californiae]|eukprot:ORY24909.1 hypothetical protein LY90DRAFT_706439 [Neocallimastix californiae]